jgi:hypothetical protein
MCGNAAAAAAAELTEHAMTRQDPSLKKAVTRRQVLTHLAGTGAALAWGVTPRAAAASPQDIQHIVLVTMENRSFDHFLGWVLGADGRQAGLTYAGITQSCGALFGAGPAGQRGQPCVFCAVSGRHLCLRAPWDPAARMDSQRRAQ